MKQKNYRLLIYFIAATIIATISIQVYWNIQNYKTNKQRLINEVQISLDNGVEVYYTDLAKSDFLSFVDTKKDTAYTLDRAKNFLQVLDIGNLSTSIDSSRLASEHSDHPFSFSSFIDSSTTVQGNKTSKNYESIAIFAGRRAADSIQDIGSFINKFTISITQDSIDFGKLDSVFNTELSRKKIGIRYRLNHLKRDTIFEQYNPDSLKHLALTTLSKSTYLPPGQQLELRYDNPTLVVLKRSMTGILLSFLLSVCIIICLLYLLHIINKQKELAEIKNDLISNITHEFKTPIATVATAIEGIKHFNEANDQAKTDKYLDISDQQLKKLHQMVEKLLETATLDSDKLIINKEEMDMVAMLQKITDKHQMLSPSKSIVFKTGMDTLLKEVDPFHFENVVTNLIDNAVKYGGDTIEVNLNSLLDATEITVADNGGKIDKNQREKIFDKFYRIPTGNRHDVKGFGIGLFYVKKIVEKHGGTIQLLPDAKNTIFKISL
ncbi:sensor histidine kinase [Spongiimicrobium salis]|uniref:sensor histidine kinase n=1 Tax=Spongiimicrobium salis TaxID=1667022 RepID=UPI00374CA517